MEITNANQNLTSDDPAWCFLAEFSLSEFLSDFDRRDALTAGVLYQTVQKLGMPPERLKNIEMTLAGFATEALEYFKQAGLEIPNREPGRVRVFCQKKVIINGGWGYFLIEKGSSSSTECARDCIDLYLYEEGE